MTFKVQHLGLAFVHGRFNDFGGTFTIDADDPTKTAFTMNVKAETIDTLASFRAPWREGGHPLSPPPRDMPAVKRVAQ